MHKSLNGYVATNPFSGNSPLPDNRDPHKYTCEVTQAIQIKIYHDNICIGYMNGEIEISKSDFRRNNFKRNSCPSEGSKCTHHQIRRRLLILMYLKLTVAGDEQQSPVTNPSEFPGQQDEGLIIVMQ